MIWLGSIPRLDYPTCTEPADFNNTLLVCYYKSQCTREELTYDSSENCEVLQNVKPTSLQDHRNVQWDSPYALSTIPQIPENYTMIASTSDPCEVIDAETTGLRSQVSVPTMNEIMSRQTITNLRKHENYETTHFRNSVAVNSNVTSFDNLRENVSSLVKDPWQKFSKNPTTPVRGSQAHKSNEASMIFPMLLFVLSCMVV